MSSQVRRRTQTSRRSWAMLVVAAMLGTMGVIVAPTAANAAGTILFQNAFRNATVDGIGSVTLPTSSSGANAACLTAGGNTSTGPLLTCAGSNDAAGSGKLRLTNSSTNQVGGVFGQTSFPTSNGLDVTFNSYQWGGGSADGLSFLLAAVDPANPASPTTMGPSGGSLGYSPAGSVRGLNNAYLGVGLDVFGNYSATGFQGSGCTNVPDITTKTAGAAVVRGPGNGLVGYCGLATTFTNSGKITLRAATRAASVVPVQVLINPTASSFTSDSGVSVAAGTYKVVVTPVGQSTKTLSGPLPAASAAFYPSANWLNANGVPKQLAFAFVGSTGSVTDAHEIDDVKVLTFNPVPQLDVAATSYSAATSTPGDPITYKVVASVRAGGSNETSPVSVTQTVPVGAVPVGAFGTGWVCAAPVGRSITCTTTGSNFPQGTTLPTVTVVGIVTGASLSDNFVQNNSQSSATSADANPETITSASAGTPSSAATGVSVNPAIGPVAGGTTVIGSSSGGGTPTAVLIGTTAELQAGTPVVLLPCPSGRAVGCFNIEGSSIAIASMPARASPATVRVTTVTLGVAGFANYVYADSPAVPVAPTATAGISSATLSWSAPVTNGSPITGYVVRPYLNGVAQSTQNFSGGTTSTTFTGLTAGTSWAYTVAATNAYGTSAHSVKSNAVVPYVLPGAPSITAASAGDSSATLTWSTPSNGGNAITAYVVTPYLGLVPQATQTFGTGNTQTVTGLTPGAAYTFTVAARNDAGVGPASVKSSAVTPNASPSLSFADPPAGEVGVAYSRLLTVTNGTSPFTWSVSVGSLPAGLTLNASSGLLSGTPTAGGSTTFTVQVSDASSQTATKSVTLVIADAPSLVFNPAAGEVGVAYSQQPALSGGTAPFAWTISSGSLPAGLTINGSTGLISGTPTAAGSSSLTVSATDSFNKVASKTVTLVVVARPAFAAGSPPSGQVGVAYSTPFTVTGGSMPLTWSITAGSAPAGLTLNAATGVLSGTPTTAGSSSFSVLVSDANGQSATKAVTIVVGAGPLVILKSADVSSTTAGGTVHFTVSITNTGSTTFSGVNLSDPLTGVLDDATYNADAVASNGTVSYNAPNLGWSGNIAAGATMTITYSVSVDNPDTGNKVLANTATSTTLGTNCAAGSPDPRCSATVNVAGLTMVKTANVATSTPGGTIDFEIVVTNTGPTTYSGAAFTDSLVGVLDDAVYNSDGAATSGNVSASGSALSWTGNLPVSGSATITYSVTVKDPDTGNRSVGGTIVSSSPGSPCPSGNPAASCTATVAVLVPALVINNSMPVSTSTPGATIPFTVTISNTGQTAYTGAAVTLALAGALDDATYNNDASSTSGVLGFSDGILTWTGNIAIGATVTVTGSITVDDPDGGNRVLTTVVTSAAAGSTCPVANPPTSCTATVEVRVPALSITKSADVTTTTPGSVVTYTVLATNTGQTAYTAASFADELDGVLDDATYNGDATATSGSTSYASPTLTWTGDLAVAASVTLTYSVTVLPPDDGDLSLVNVVTSTTPGNNCRSSSTDPLCASTVAVRVPGLTFGGSVDATSATPGQVVHYTRTVTNTGQTTYQNAEVLVDLRGLLDDATYNNDATVTGGTQQVHPNGTVTWTITLAPGQSVTSTMSVTVKDPDPADRALRTLVTSDAPGSTCPTGSANPACTTMVPVLVPGLTITKTADRSTVTPGEPVEYTIVVTNSGETTYAAATFTDDLSRVLTDATYSGDATASSGTVSYSTPVLTWTGALAPGATATISYSAAIRDPDPGDKRLVNSVVSPTKGSNCASGSSDARCTTTVAVLVPGLTINTTADSATTEPGATVNYSVIVTNSGATSYTGASFTESLEGVMDDADYDGNVSATSGTASAAAGVLTWTGNLAVGASATVTFSVTVHEEDGGNNRLITTVTSGSRANNCVVGSSDNRCGSNVPVARLVLAYGAIDPTTTPGATVNYTATYTNTGQVPYNAITVDVFAPSAADDGLPGVQNASSGVLTIGATGITWNGSIPVGGVVSLDAQMQIRDPNPGDGVITAVMESVAPGNNCTPGSTDPRCTVTITVLTPGLTISKVANKTATVPGGTVGYTITVHNTGQTAYSDAVVSDTLAGLLDDATYNADATATTGSLAFTSPTLTWTGDLSPGETATITYSVTAHNPDSGDKTMANPVSSTAVGSTCPPAGGGAACHTTVLVLTPRLTIVKTADHLNATLDTEVTYTITVRNSGQTSYAAANFTDSLADVLDDATYDPDSTTSSSGAVDYTDGVLSWSGALAPGATATITYLVTVNSSATGDQSMSNLVNSSSVGSNCAAGVEDARCASTVAITNSVSLTLTKTADVTATQAGDTVTFTVEATNSSDSPVVADFEDPLSGILDDATYNGDATATGGTVTFTEPTISWAGTVDAGATVAITYSVTVHPTVTGDQVLQSTLSSVTPAGSNNCLANSLDPRCTNVVPVAGLLIEQSYAESSTTAGSLVHLSASFTNTGKMPYTGITISSPSAGVIDDAVPTGDQVASSGDLVLSATAITWTGSIPVGGTVTVEGTLTVKSPDTGDKLLTGTLVSGALGNNCPVDGVDVRCTATLSVLLPGLTITKTANTPAVPEGGVVGYTVTVDNTGETPYSGATVTDSLTGVLDDADYNGDAGSTVGDVSYANTTLTWTGDLGVGESTVIDYSVTTRTPGTGDKTMLNSVASDDVGSTCIRAAGTPTCTTIVAVLTPALTITSSTDVATSVPGDTVTYTLIARNTGQTYYPDAGFTVPLAGVQDDATIVGTPEATSGTATLTATDLTWAGGLAPGEFSTITYAVVVMAEPAGDYTLAQTVVSATPGNSCPAAGSDPRCTTNVTVAALFIRSTTDVATTQPGGVVRHTITIENRGKVPYFDADVNVAFGASLDDAVYNGDALVTAGNLTFDEVNGGVIWSGDLPVGGPAVTVTGSLTVMNPDPGDRVMTTIATSSEPASNCPDTGPGPDCGTSVIVLTPELTITKVASESVVSPGDTVGYTITATNTGETAYTGAVVKDRLQGILNDASYNEDANATSGSVGFADSELTWTGDLAVGASVEIRFTVEVTSPYGGDGTIRNQVISDETGSTCATGSPVTACAADVVVLTPALDLSIVADRSTTIPGATVGYTVMVHNRGETDYSGAEVTASLAGVLDDADYADDATATTGQLGLAGSNLTWTGDLAAGSTATITFSVIVLDPDPGNLSLVASVGSSEAGSGCVSDGSCTSTVSVLIPGLAITNTADVSTATPGDPVGFTIVVTNTGQTPYVGTVVTSDLSDVVDDAALEGTVTSSSGVVTFTAPDLTWTGNLQVGEQATIHYTVIVSSPDAGDHTMSSTVVATDQGSTCPAGTANAACTATVSVLIPSLSIAKTAGSATATPGSVIEYTIVVTNDGETAYAAARVDDSLVGVLADADYNLDASVDGGGTLGYEDATLSWTGALPMGSTATITYSITVHDPDVGDKHLVNAVTSPSPGSTCPVGGSDPGCSATVDVLVPALLITKTADSGTVVAGNQVAFTITVTNTGQTPYLPAVVTDSLAEVVDDASYDGNAVADIGSVDDSTDTLVWTGPLELGETATITYSVTADFPAMGDKVLVNAALSDSPGSNCPSVGDPRCSTSVAVVIPALVISKVVDTTEVVAGGAVQYTITATNNGAADYPAAGFADSLTQVLDDAVYNGDAVATVGAVEFAGSTLSWTGALPMGASATVTYSVTTDVIDTGDAQLTNGVVSASVGSTCPVGGSEPECSTSTPIAPRSIALSGLTSAFTLSGPPHTTVSSQGAVTMTVTTNVAAGYSVSVLATSEDLTGATPGNLDTIPLSLLEVRETGTTDYFGLSTSELRLVHDQQDASGPGGDAVSNDYQISIPNVLPDTYSTTLNYIVVAH